LTIGARNIRYRWNLKPPPGGPRNTGARSGTLRPGFGTMRDGGGVPPDRPGTTTRGGASLRTHSPWELRVSPSRHSFGAGTQLPLSLSTSPGPHAGFLIGPHTPLSRISPGAQPSGGIGAQPPLRSRSSPGGHDADGIGVHAPLVSRNSPGGHNGAVVGTQAPVTSRNCPGPQDRRSEAQDLPSTPTKRLLQHVPSGIFV
jgi:hypothetical protein